MSEWLATIPCLDRIVIIHEKSASGTAGSVLVNYILNTSCMDDHNHYPWMLADCQEKIAVDCNDNNLMVGVTQKQLGNARQVTSCFDEEQTHGAEHGVRSLFTVLFNT